MSTRHTVLTELQHSQIDGWADLEVDDSKKTYSRRLVENHLMKYKWYNPHLDRNDMPNLKTGWAFYEHMTLARHVVEGHDSELKRAAAADTRETKLYSFWETKESSLKDWGVGIGLYFSTLRFFALFLFVGGMFSLRNMIYFSSSDYDSFTPDPDGGFISLFASPLSAVCTTKEWVRCEENFCHEERMRFKVVDYAISDNKFYVERNMCPVSDTNDNDTIKAGLWNISTVVVLMVLTVAFSIFQSKQQTVMDEDQVTASDYSIRVMNPPQDAYDPDEWRDFFDSYSENKGVTMVTIILDNAVLLRQLKARRFFMKELQRKIPTLDFNCSPAQIREQVITKSMANQEKVESCSKKLFNITLRPIFRIFNHYLETQVLLERIVQKTELIQEHQKKEYPVSSVIVTFETEKGKRTALEALQLSTIELWRQNTVDAQHAFKGKLLRLIEPTEPSALRMLTLDVPFSKRVIQFMITLIITIALIVLSYFWVTHTRNTSGAFWAGILTTFLNIIIPVVVKVLLLIENHPREDDRQRSLYIKVTLFRWVNTAITAKFAVPSTHTLGAGKNDLIVAITGIVLAEIYLAPLISILDIMGNLSKHYYAPRATVIEQLFICFKGTYYNLADKYTDITKIVFVCYYYCALNPLLLFMGSLALIVRYISDKFCLLRIWGDVPYIGSQIAQFSRQYFLSFAIVAGTVVSAYDWALFSFDRVCEGKGGEVNNNLGTFEAKIYKKANDFEAVTTDITVTSNATVRVCREDKCCQEVGFQWPPVSENFESDDFAWMSPGQRTVTSVFGWLSVVAVITFFLGAFGHTAWTRFKTFFRGGIDESELGTDQNIDFSNLEKVSGYIPQIREPSLAFPLIICNIDEVPLHLLDFQLPEGSIDELNVMFDVPYEGMKRTRMIESSTKHSKTISEHDEYQVDDPDAKEPPIFDIVKYWSHGGKQF